MKQIDECFSTVWNDHKKSLTLKQQQQLGVQMFQLPLWEDKQIGIRIWKDMYKQLENNHIDQIKNNIIQGYAYEWATIDSLCVRVLTPWSQISKKNTQYISQWRFEKDNLWVRRACCVTFVNRARHGDSNKNFKGFTDIMFEICQEIVQYNERFSQLGCGWLMRNLSQYDKQRAINFIQDNYDHYSREGLRYAIEKLSTQEKKRLLNYNSQQTENDQSEDDQDENSSEEQQQQQKQKRKPKKISQKSKKQK